MYSNAVDQFETYEAGNQAPTRTFTLFYDDPSVEIYFKLNHENFLDIINDSPAYWYNNCVVTPTNDSPAFGDQVQVNESPRATFPSDLGTDGQRLKQGEADSPGQALNFIGNLFFRTDDDLFLDIRDNLAKGKLTVKQALAAANLLAEHDRGGS